METDGKACMDSMNPYRYNPKTARLIKMPTSSPPFVCKASCAVQTILEGSPGPLFFLSRRFRLLISVSDGMVYGGRGLFAKIRTFMLVVKVTACDRRSMFPTWTGDKKCAMTSSTAGPKGCDCDILVTDDALVYYRATDSASPTDYYSSLDE